MKMSCNGCRVLRKGCSENCSIRPCLQLIKTPQSQANATLFLAKFYGRAGLLNLINAGQEHLRPSIFSSLLYEACGRIVNPIYGSVGLVWSGSWQLCQAAVEAVLKGDPIVQIPSDAALITPTPFLKPYDIRHMNSAASLDLHKLKTWSRFKRSAAKPSTKVGLGTGISEPVANDSAQWRRCYPRDFKQAPGHDSSVSQQLKPEPNGEGDSRETESMFSVETVEGSVVSRAEWEPVPETDSEVELELALGFEPVSCPTQNVGPVKGRSEIYGADDDTCKMELGLVYLA